MRIEPLPQLRDNYAYLVIDDDARSAVIVDAAEADVVASALSSRGLAPIAVLSTHHHGDHTGGNEGLAERFPGLRIVGSAVDGPRIAAITERVRDGDTVALGAISARVAFIPCHTSGHVAYVIGDDVFTGDTLFAGGCGRFFEGTAAEMYRALYAMLGALPDHARVWCGHEYTVKNLEFALDLEPNDAVAARLEDARATRAAGRPTVPSTMGLERRTNPFLRVRDPSLAAAVARKTPGLDVHDPIAVLAALRALKDRA